MGNISLKNGLFMIRERRAHVRRQIAVPIIYGYLRSKTFICNDGTTCDLSTAGMSFYADKPFREGENLQIQSSYLCVGPRVGTVRWCGMKTYYLYKIGILFQ